MKTKVFFFSSVVLLMTMLSAFQFLEDSPFIKKLKSNLRAYQLNFPQEKIYLQLDKTIYRPGEDIWINAFVLSSNTHQPTNVSDVVYLELVDPMGNIASRLDLPVTEGTAHGDFALLSTAPGGLYKVRAYTNWMKNFGDEYSFSKEVQVHKVLTPRLLLNMDFQKESYGPGELVSAELAITNLKNEKVADGLVNIAVQIAGHTFLRKEIKPDQQGVANINFKLPDTLTRADGLLHAVVSSHGVEESITRSIPIVLNKVTIQFFPEGGRWVQGVASRVGFKALNEFGKGADVEGVILNENDEVVTTFASFHMGMGAFEMTPLVATRYFARIDNLGGKHPLIPLPEVELAGLTLSVTQQEAGSLEWRINSPSDFNGHLVAQSHGDIYFGERVRLKPGNNSLKVSTQNFPTGIAVFTLFDEGGLEQCERLVFLNRQKKLAIQLKTDKEKYLPREAVNLDIKTVNENGYPVPSKISLAVVDDQLISFADDKQDNMLSSMLLSSEVRGEVEESSFYFDPEEPKAEEALDYLLMTQGWRRFTWKQVTDNNMVIRYSPEKNKNLGGILLSGQGSGTSEEVTLLELGGRKRIIKVQATKEGYFMFKNVDPTIPLLLLAPKAVEIRVVNESPFTVSFNDQEGPITLPVDAQRSLPVQPFQSSAVVARTMQTGGADFSLGLDVQQLTEVIVTAQGIESSRRSMGYSSVVREPEIWNVSGSPSLENVLQGRVAGIMITQNSGNAGSAAAINIRGLSSMNSGRGEPLYVIDGHPIGSSLNQNFSNGSFISPNEINSIEVIQSPVATALYGSAAANGVIQITTRSRFGHYIFSWQTKTSEVFKPDDQSTQVFSYARILHTSRPARPGAGKK